MQAERSVRRHLCLWLPDPLPPDEAERGEQLKASHRREREQKRLEAFAFWCQQFSPCVSIEREPGEVAAGEPGSERERTQALSILRNTTEAS